MAAEALPRLPSASMHDIGLHEEIPEGYVEYVKNVFAIEEHKDKNNHARTMTGE